LGDCAALAVILVPSSRWMRRGGTLERPFEAYEGNEPYVFVCYSHDDKRLVYPELTRLKDAGFHIWYDEGIGAGSEWSESIASHIERCAAFLYFVTPRSVDREHCRRELNFAIDQSRRVLAVHLVPTELPSGLRLTLSNRQAILKYDEPRAAYEAKLARAIGDARSDDIAGATGRPHTTAPHRWHAKSVTGAAVALAIAASLSVWFANRPTQVSSLPDRSLAVMSFSVVGGDAEAATYADAVTQELRTDVAGYQEIRSVAVEDTTNIRDVSDASYVVGGNVQRGEASLRVRASLTRTDGPTKPSGLRPSNDRRPTRRPIQRRWPRRSDGSFGISLSRINDANRCAARLAVQKRRLPTVPPPRRRVDFSR
jgi:TIR domain